MKDEGGREAKEMRRCACFKLKSLLVSKLIHRTCFRFSLLTDSRSGSHSTRTLGCDDESSLKIVQLGSSPTLNDDKSRREDGDEKEEKHKDNIARV